MNWLIKKFDTWAGKKQADELFHFVQNLKSMDGSEIGLLLACATHVRHELEALGHDLLNPTIYTSQNPSFPLMLSKAIISFQKSGQTPLAAAYMIWLHTARAGCRLELRSLGRQMWKELERGFSHAAERAIDLKDLVGMDLKTEGFKNFPHGLTPEPL